ncbi:DUF222 domain-containing protein [Kribbella sp. NPDC026596]|uniref:HNH endonuclease signature motif containing protein n=1 Tax=Kribbella sp. NPDC026596 TaxID=3155122 RepID=UPI0033DA82D1
MELLGERPVWSMSGGELLTTLDQLDADLARRQTYRLQVIARLDEIGHAQEIGAHDTAQLLAFRYRLDRPEARRDVHLALTLSKYPAVSAALPATADIDLEDRPGDPGDPSGVPGDPSGDPEDLPADARELIDDSDEADATETAELFLRPAQAGAIVSALEKVPATVPVEDLEVAERELVGLARHLSPAELRKAGQRVRDVLDTDGPEPDERKAYDRETLTLIGADRGVKFRGYLANENAELLRSLIHAGARPHRTIDGELDPRPRDKRQADALTTALTLATTAYDTATTPPSTTPPGTIAAGTTGPGTTAAGTSGPGTIAAGTTGPGTTAAGMSDPGTTAAGVSGPGTTADGTTGAGTSAAAATGRGAAGASTAGAGVVDADGTTGAGRSEAGRSGRVPGFGAKATITVTIDLQDLKSAAADAIGDTVYGDGLSAAAIRRMACDAKVIPLVLGSNSQPLDVGRAERLVTGAMRRALNARDKGCVVCGAPPVHCDAHHLQSWIDGGITAIHNLALLCRRHHIDLHAGDWIITITNGVVHVARPSWADPSPQRRTAQPQRRADSSRPQRQPATPSLRTGPSLSECTAASQTGANPAGPSRMSSPDTGASSSGPSRTAALLEVRGSLSPTASGMREGMLQRLLLADGESSGGMSPCSLREAASLAIWGEAPTPEAEQASQGGSAMLGDQAGEQPGDLSDEGAADLWCEEAVVRPAS